MRDNTDMSDSGTVVNSKTLRRLCIGLAAGALALSAMTGGAVAKTGPEATADTFTSLSQGGPSFDHCERAAEIGRNPRTPCDSHDGGDTDIFGSPGDIVEGAVEGAAMGFAVGAADPLPGDEAGSAALGAVTGAIGGAVDTSELVQSSGTSDYDPGDQCTNKHRAYGGC